MAVSTQSRKSERAATQNPAETLESPSLREACLSVRLWSDSGGSAPARSLWENDSPAACLTLDLIAASEGLPTSRQGEVLVASFPTFQSAAMTARRLQWAMQGYAEAEEPKATSLALLIHSTEEGAAETVAEDAFHSLAQAPSGSILLTEKASQPFDRLPGFPLQVAAGDGLWELAWGGSEGNFSRSEDEEFLTRFAPEQNLQEQAPQPAEPQAAEKADFTEDYRTGSQRKFSAEEPQKKSWGMIGGLALAAVVVVAVAIYLFAGKSSKAPVADQTMAQTQPQAAPESTPESGPAASKESSAAETVQSKHPASQQAAPMAKTPKNAPKPEAQPAQEPPQEKERPAPKPVEPPVQKASKDSRCDLDPSQYSGQIDQAWKNLGRGKYDAAKRQFGAVLACDSNNQKAREGLERARAAAEAEGGSDN